MNNEEGVNRFVDFYMKETNEKIRLKYKKKDKQRSVFNVKSNIQMSSGYMIRRNKESWDHIR